MERKKGKKKKQYKRKNGNGVRNKCMNMILGNN